MAAARTALETADEAAANAIAAAAAPAIADAWLAYAGDASRSALQALAKVLRDLDAQCRTVTGAELPAFLIVAAFAQAVIKARPKTEGVLMREEFRGDILSPTARLLRAAVAGAGIADLETQADAIELWFAKRTRAGLGVEPAKEEREAFAVLLQSGRQVDRANRLAALAHTQAPALAARMATPTDDSGNRSAWIP